MKIALATGGSGGHIFPALKTAEQLKKEGHEVFFIGALSSVEERLKTAGFPYIILNAEGFSLKEFFRFWSLMTKAIAQSREFLDTWKPDMVVGFGSYSSFPVLYAASRAKIPSMLHEQNVIPGKANKLSARFVRKIAVSFDETRASFSGRNVIWTGCPCNSQPPKESKLDILQSFGFSYDRPTFLVLGGSQGSHRLNEIFFEAIPSLGNIQVIHMTGKSDEQVYLRKYSEVNIPYHVCSFLNNIQQAYAVADIVIGRAGAATVSELASFGLPSVLIPYPFAHSHQAANARVLEKAGVAVVIEQKGMTAKMLVDAVRALQSWNLTPAIVRQRLKGAVIENPTEKLVQTIVSLKS